METKLYLTYIGRDQWNYPVYEDQNGKLWKDIDCREGYEGRLCYVEDNKFENEVDGYMSPDIECVFVPERIKDPHDSELEMVTILL